jgi:hypothetical protein
MVLVYVALCRGKPFRIENRPQNLSFQVCVCVCVCACVWVGVNKSIKAAVTDIFESRRTRSTAGKRDDWDWCDHLRYRPSTRRRHCFKLSLTLSLSRSSKQAQPQFP